VICITLLCELRHRLSVRLALEFTTRTAKVPANKGHVRIDHLWGVVPAILSIL